MGNRLIHFLVEALPRHPAYMKKDPLVTRLREKSFQSLVQVKKRIEALALRIDEEQLNKYIMHDFDPFADDDDSTSTSSCSDLDHFSSSGRSHSANDNPQWESFDGWSFDLPEKLTQQRSNERGLSSSNDLDVSGETEDTSNETFSSSETSFQASDDYEPIYGGFGVEFLKRIASEEVRYETDSEADDSWAQECESEVESAIYSTTSQDHITCDPARIALQELMLNKRRQLPQYSSKRSIVEAPTDELDDDNEQHDGSNKENQSLNFDLSPDNSFDSEEEEEEIWTPFDPKTLLPSSSVYADRVAL